MTDASRFFAQTYAEARQGFVAAAEEAGLDVHGHAHPMLGKDGEPLAMDAARFGPADAPALLIDQPRAQTSSRLLAGKATRSRSAKPTAVASLATSASRRRPQAGSRARRSASNARLLGAVGTSSST